MDIECISMPGTSLGVKEGDGGKDTIDKGKKITCSILNFLIDQASVHDQLVAFKYKLNMIFLTLENMDSPQED